MVDSITLVMFAFPMGVAVIFSLLTIIPKGEDKESATLSGSVVSLMSAILAAILWFISGLVWPALATTAMMVSIGYLWYAIGIIFVAFAIFIGVKMLGEIFRTETPRLTLQRSYDGGGAD